MVVVAGFTVAVMAEATMEAAGAVSTVEVAEATIVAEAVVQGLVAAADRATAEAAPTGARGLSAEEVRTPVEAFVADRRVATTEAVEVRTAASVRRAA